jgi:alpha-tubulin suppressor-like RCC1 family protein
MNLNNFQILLQKAIDSSDNTTDFLLLSKALQSLGVGQVREVATYANLPDAAANEGLLVFVTADERVYWSTGTAWYSLSLENEGFSWGWGSNFGGRLGDGTSTNTLSPVSVIGGFTDWCSVSAGYAHSLGITGNGIAWSWGESAAGELGDGTVSDRSSPVSVVGGFTDWCGVSAGRTHSLAVRCNGSAWAWGDNTCGVLGDNTTTNRSSPVSVVGDFTDWCQVAAGRTHSLGVRCNGTAWAWGTNSCGVLGDNTVTPKCSPVSVVGEITDWCQVAAGSLHSLAVKRNGTAWAWGNSGAGRLGDNQLDLNRCSPVSVVGGFTDWCQVSAGGGHSLGVRQNGSAWAWGCNQYGRLGDGTTTNKSSPVSVVGGFTDWCQVSAGFRHSLGVRQNGSAWGWGYNRDTQAGVLGDNTVVTKSSPVSVVGGFTDWCQVSAGAGHSLGVRQNGTAWAWGCNTNGRLGNGFTGEQSSPVSVVGGFTDWCQVSAGCLHSLGVRQNGTAWAWGDGLSGRLGDNTTTNRCSPVSVVGGFTDWCQVGAGDCHSLGVRQNGTAWAWGQGTLGRLGDGTITDKSSPVSVVGGLTGWCQVSAGGCHSLGVISL